MEFSAIQIFLISVSPPAYSKRGDSAYPSGNSQCPSSVSLPTTAVSSSVPVD